MALKAVAAPLGSPVGGSGTPGTIPIWNTTTALTDSPLSFATSTLTYSSAVTAQTFAANQTWTLPNNAFAFAVGGTGNATLKLDTNNRYVGIDSPSTPSDKLHLAESGALALRMQNVTAATYWQHKVDGSGNWGLAVNGGTNALTVLSANGNVGIGTASPGTRLHVNAGSGIRVTDATGTAGFDMLNIGNDAYLYNRNNGLLVFGANNTARMRINSAGATEADSQVAIGTSSFATFTGGAVAGLTTVRDVSVNGVRVGMGRGAVASNTAVGAGALDAGTSGQSNTAVGVSAAAAIATSSFQTAVGARAAQANTAASSTMVGADCAVLATSASEITAVGSFCLGATLAASRTSAVGCLALYSITGSNDTCALGHSAGRFAGAGATANTSATDSIFIGSDSRAGASGNSNEIVIGKGAIGNGSNTVTIGNSSNVGTFLDTKYVSLVDSYTVGTLPGAGTAGRIARVTDGDAALAWGATVVNTGAGATPYLVWDNGANWTVFGK
jgi:hypothetical protein